MGCSERFCFCIPDLFHDLFLILSLQNTALNLRMKHRILGAFVGTRRGGSKDQSPAMPVVLLPEEAALALQRGWLALSTLHQPQLESTNQRQNESPLDVCVDHCLNPAKDRTSPIQEENHDISKRPRLNSDETTTRVDGGKVSTTQAAGGKHRRICPCGVLAVLSSHDAPCITMHPV
jgi:hypothetical protein